MIISDAEIEDVADSDCGIDGEGLTVGFEIG